eukprot:XP_027304155.1 uncharacterized protein LOC113841671 [Anas platyrhynchos]
MDKLLQKYKCAPSQAGKEFSQKFWNDEEKVVERIEQCQASKNIGQRKGKGAICAVLGACLSCARQEAKETPAPKVISDAEHTALKSEIDVLKSSLAFERETGKTLGIRVDKLLDENDKLVHENNHLKQLLERVSHLLNKVQPCAPVKQIRGVLHNAEPESWDSDFWSDSDDGVEEISDSEPQSISLRPLVKTETTVDDNDEIRTTVRTIPLPPAELVKIQEKFSRRSGESEVEYVCQVSLKTCGHQWGPSRLHFRAGTFQYFYKRSGCRNRRHFEQVC